MQRVCIPWITLSPSDSVNLWPGYRLIIVSTSKLAFTTRYAQHRSRAKLSSGSAGVNDPNEARLKYYLNIIAISAIIAQLWFYYTLLCFLLAPSTKHQQLIACVWPVLCVRVGERGYWLIARFGSVQFSPLTDWVVEEKWVMIQWRYFSTLFCGRELWSVLVWAELSIPWRCPSSIFSADHGVAHSPRCPEEWFGEGGRGLKVWVLILNI